MQGKVVACLCCVESLALTEVPATPDARAVVAVTGAEATRAGDMLSATGARDHGAANRLLEIDAARAGAHDAVDLTTVLKRTVVAVKNGVFDVTLHLDSACRALSCHCRSIVVQFIVVYQCCRVVVSYLEGSCHICTRSAIMHTHNLMF